VPFKSFFECCFWELIVSEVITILGIIRFQIVIIPRALTTFCSPAAFFTSHIYHPPT
jgi:hypothetical protein